jgi:hypothetical protein
MTTSGLETRRHTSFGAPVAMIVGVVAVVFALTVAFNYGRTLHAGATSVETAAIENEDNVFCTGLGFARDSDLFARCRSGLANIRQAHQDRINATAIGIF